MERKCLYMQIVNCQYIIKHFVELSKFLKSVSVLFDIIVVLTMISNHVYLSKYLHSDKTTESRININNRSTTILVKTISTLGLVSEYHEFFHYIKFCHQ